MLSCGGESAALAGDHRSIAAVLFGVAKGLFDFGQPPESKQRPRLSEPGVAEARFFGQDELVLTKRFGWVVADESDRRETHPIFERVGIGHEAGAVRMFRIVDLPQPEADDAERVPELGVARCAPDCLLEPRARELVLAPGSGSKSPFPRTCRIARCDFCGFVVERKRLFIAMRQLERVP